MPEPPASELTKSTASLLQRPPVSTATTTRAQRLASYELLILQFFVSFGSECGSAVDVCCSWAGEALAGKGTPHGHVHGELCSMVNGQPTGQHLSSPFVLCADRHVHISELSVASNSGTRFSANAGHGPFRTDSPDPQPT